MVTFSKQNKSSLQRRGKQVLKAKFSQYRRRNSTLLKLNKKKLFERSIILTPNFRLMGNKHSSIRTVHTTNAKTSSSPSPFQNGFSGNTTQADDRGSVVAEKKKQKKLSIKKLLGIKKGKKSPSKGTFRAANNGVQTKKMTKDAKPPNATTPINMESSASTSVHSLHSLESKGGNLLDNISLEPADSVGTADTTNPNTPVRGGEEDNCDSLPVTPTSDSQASATANSRDPYIFVDTDDDQDYEKKEETRESLDESIQAQLDQEMKRLDERIRKKKEEKRVIAEDKLQNSKIEESETTESDKANKYSVEPQNCIIGKNKQNRLLPLMALLVPAVALISWFISNVMVTPYNHEMVMEKAGALFKATNTEKPMKGITVVVSETESKLGSTIEDRFAQLGATVASVEIDCNDLKSVSKSVEFVTEQFSKIDILVHTGNLCIVNKNYESFTSESVQGYNSLFAGNYLSSFLLTQKILPQLEQSRFGSLVQFTSPVSTLVDGSQLKVESSFGAKSILPAAKQKESYFSTLLNLPLQFANVKLSESLQHQVIAREYPNIRTIEISRGWIGRRGADNLFDKIFRAEYEEEANPPASTSISDDEDLQDGLYEWSQNAVRKWIASPTPAPIATMLLQSPANELVDSNGKSHTTVAYTAASRLGLAVGIGMVTSSSFALMVLKANPFSSWSSNTWWSSE